MSTALSTLTTKLANRFAIPDAGELMTTLKQTAFKGQVTDAQMTALLLVAEQYGLNPWTKEIYAFPDRNNGIVPVVGVDGWSRIINEHPQFDGLDFDQDDESCTCIIFRKDRNHPTKVTEYMTECKRDGVGPWKSHPKRMLRHKALIQCARLAFGFVGIYEQDEAERMADSGKETSSGVIVNVTAIESASSIEELQSAFAEAWRSNTDKDARAILTKAKDNRKKQLQESVIDVDPATGEVINGTTN